MMVVIALSPFRVPLFPIPSEEDLLSKWPQKTNDERLDANAILSLHGENTLGRTGLSF
ncbi:hypothetical protein RLEG3_02770 (plasmid) [Rhizobium leguminosarum bv. trifolii WSM1689]|nr:hypothetical protein RLEG3_02770 [Rhizobium leguminosarum bv. trifolii WSM1689]